MKNLLFFAAMSITPHAMALSYECETNGETVLQNSPCPDVNYSKNLTAPPKTAPGGMTLSESLAARGGARESIANHGRNLAVHNAQLNLEAARNNLRNEYLNKAQESRDIAAAWKSYGLRVAPVIDNYRADEYERKAQRLE